MHAAGWPSWPVSPDDDHGQSSASLWASVSSLLSVRVWAGRAEALELPAEAGRTVWSQCWCARACGTEPEAPAPCSELWGGAEGQGDAVRVCLRCWSSCTKPYRRHFPAGDRTEFSRLFSRPLANGRGSRGEGGGPAPTEVL